MEVPARAYASTTFEGEYVALLARNSPTPTSQWWLAYKNGVVTYVQVEVSSPVCTYVCMHRRRSTCPPEQPGSQPAKVYHSVKVLASTDIMTLLDACEICT